MAIKRLMDKENKGNSDVSIKPRDSQVGYVEIDFTERDSLVTPHLGKRSRVEGTRKIPDIPPRRAFSQSDERPSTLVPSIDSMTIRSQEIVGTEKYLGERTFCEANAIFAGF